MDVKKYFLKEEKIELTDGEIEMFEACFEREVGDTADNYYFFSAEWPHMLSHVLFEMFLEFAKEDGLDTLRPEVAEYLYRSCPELDKIL